jgi:hypothetical protein
MAFPKQLYPNGFSKPAFDTTSDDGVKKFESMAYGNSFFLA